MTANQLKRAFDKYYSFPFAFWDSILKQGTITTVEKETTIKKSFQVENYLYYLINGSGGILLWNKENYICTDMILSGEFMCDYLSFITRKETPYEVIIFEESEIFKISYDALITCLNENKFEDKFWRHAIEALYIDKHHQYIQSMVYTAADIYELILEHQPEIIQRIPQKYIASYLGITPQSLSRIRNKN
jgi:CRP-like cAMP-binding protein